MYRLGSDTASLMALFLHGAKLMTAKDQDSSWLPDDKKEAFLRDAWGLVNSSVARSALTIAETRNLESHCTHTLFGGSTSPTPLTRKLMPPRGDFNWDDVHKRVTLGWNGDGILIFTALDLGGSGGAPPNQELIRTENAKGLTLFLGGPRDADAEAPLEDAPVSASASRSGIEFISIDGKELQKVWLDDAAFREKDLSELSRQTGIEIAKFKEAFGMLDKYRLQHGLLQRSVYSKLTGGHEFLSVIPEGDWRTVEYGGERRRLTLRRYVVLILHCTAAPIETETARCRP